jgi:predicted glycosyltransferase
MSGPRVLFYVQHLLGIGHLKRAATLTRTLQASGMSVMLVSGGAEIPGLDLGDAALVQLPPVRAVDIYFKELVDDNGRTIDDAWKAARRDRLLASFARLQPDIVMTELFPFGRRQLRFELIPLLDAATAQPNRPLIVSSVRDILVEPAKPERLTEMLDLVKRYYDLVLVHGDPNLIPFHETFPHAAAIADRLRYTGYVVDRPAVKDPLPGPQEVLVSAGGGAVSEPLLRAALAARPLTKLGAEPWRFLVGHSLDDDCFRGLAQDAPDNVVVERARPDFIDLLRRCRLSISQGGYNTVMEVLDAGVRSVVVPYAGGLESEQTLRARLLAERDALQVVPADALSPTALAAAADRAVSGPPPELSSLDTTGVETSAQLLREAVAARR